MNMLKRRAGMAALLVSCVALVAALTGVAVGLPGKGSVDANDLKRNAVKTKALKDGAVTAPKLAGVVVHTADSAPTADSDGTQNGGAGPVAHATATASCASGEKLLTGGAKWISGQGTGNRNLYINESYPDGNSWKADGIVDFGAQGQATLQAIAVCLK